MDKFWSIFAMPIGLFICFTPLFVAWLKSGAGSSDDKNDRE